MFTNIFSSLHYYSRTDLITALPGSSSVNMIHHAAIHEVVFSMSSVVSSGGTSGLCNQLVGNGLVNTFPCIGLYYERGDIVNNRDGVFHGVCAMCL